MGQALQLYWVSIRAWWDELPTLIPANLLWSAITLLPIALGLMATWVLPPVVMWAAFAISLVAFPGATAGLHLLANEVAHQRRAPLSLFWRGFRDHFWQALGLALVDLALAVIIVSNYYFYGQFTGAWVNWVQGAWLAVGIFWLAVQFYLLPLFMEQISPHVLLPFRNAAFMILATPLVTATALILALVTLAVNLVLIIPLLAGGMSLLAVFGNQVTLTKLQDFKEMHEPSKEEPSGQTASQDEPVRKGREAQDEASGGA